MLMTSRRRLTALLLATVFSISLAGQAPPAAAVRVTQPNVFNLVEPNMFAGSILDLEPDTAYEARFVLSDPDGVGGPAADATKTVTVRTRPEPKHATGGKVYH